MNAVKVMFQDDFFGETQEITIRARASTSVKDEKRVSPQESFMLEIETALGLKRRFKNGELVFNSLGIPAYGLLKRNFRGEYPASTLSGFVKEAMLYNCRIEAERSLAPLFESHENEPLLQEGLVLLAARLRLMEANDDPRVITKVFIETFAQQNFLDNERTGDTIRNLVKKHNAEERRRAAGIKPRNFKKAAVVIEDDENGEDEVELARKAEAAAFTVTVEENEYQSETEWEAQVERSARKYSKKKRMADVIDISGLWLE